MKLNFNSETISSVESEKVDLIGKNHELEKHLKEKMANLTEKESEILVLKQRIEEMDEEIKKGEKLRKKLHNEVMELKGNVRVFCRVRPFLPNEQVDEEESVKTIEESSEITITQPSTSTMQVSKQHPFSFDKVFGPTCNQETVFEEISQLVQSVLDGYRVCIFAYGQTGSGKTFTMEGGPGESEGMIPRAVDQIYETAIHMKEKGWTHSMEATFVEIYNEQIRDLLSNKNEKHEIKHRDNQTMVTNIESVKVSSPSEVHEILKSATKNRSVGVTECNERSSRSHSVFTLKIEGSNEITGEKCSGIINLIDLAGSERLAQSKATGDRLKETQAINKSLSSLGDVISSLANKESHVPYRNSKLTYLLQNSLGGNTKTLMFVNVAPSKESVHESICSLRFATKVNSCQIGTARKNVK